MGKTIFIPLGTRCNGATIIKEHIQGRQFSMPFDWIDIHIRNVAKIVGFSLEDYKSYLTQVKQHTQRHEDGTWFPHDIEYTDYRLSDNVIEKYLRRFERFKEILSGDDDLYFLTVLAHATGKMGDQADFFALKDVILANTKANCRFITVNLCEENEDFPNNHTNFHVPLPEGMVADGESFALWEKVVYERIKHTIP